MRSKNGTIVRHPDGRVNIFATARANGMKGETLNARIRGGMPIEEALEKPLRGTGCLNITATARANGIHPATLCRRLRKGMPLNAALAKPKIEIGPVNTVGQMREYCIWSNARGRTRNPNDVGWENYGGRGIKMCERWLNSFEAFLEDMGRRPSSQHTLERRDNDKGYCPENCYWATRKEQSSNTRKTIYVKTPWGSHVLKDACRLAGINYNTVRGRVRRRGISHEEALFNFKRLDHNTNSK